MSFLLLWSLRASAVILIGGLLALALRRRSAATRNLVLRITLAVAWLVPFAAIVAPRVEIPASAPTIALAPAVPNFPRTFQSPTPITEGWSIVQPDSKDVTTLGFQRVTPFSTMMISTVLPLLAFWSVGTGFLLLRWGLSLRWLLRLRRAATPTDAPDVWRAAIAVPATYGRTILVPHESADWPEARLRAAILHERAHVARRDWHWQTVAALFAAVHWANPLAWLLARLLRDVAEAAADDAVLAQGVLPSAYARELLAVAQSVGPTGPALAMARRGGVKDRVVAILADHDRGRPTHRVAALLGGVLATLGIGVAGVTRQQARQDGPPRVIAVRERTPNGVRAWLPDGTPVPDPGPTPGDWTASEVVLPAPGRHRIQFVFDTPTVPYAVGGPRVEFRASGSIVPFFILPRDRGHGRSRVQVNAELDDASPATGAIRVGVPFGPMAPLGPAHPTFTVERLTKTKLVDGKPVPEVRVYTADPKGGEGDFRFIAYGPDGRELPSAGDGWMYHDGRFCGTFATGGRVARVAFLAQRYRWTDFPAVALRPVANGGSGLQSERRLKVRVEAAPRRFGNSVKTLYVRIDGRAPTLDRPFRLTGYDARGKPQCAENVPAVKGRVWISSNVVVGHPERIAHWTLRSLAQDAARWDSNP